MIRETEALTERSSQWQIKHFVVRSHDTGAGDQGMLRTLDGPDKVDQNPEEIEEA